VEITFVQKQEMDLALVILVLQELYVTYLAKLAIVLVEITSVIKQEMDLVPVILYIMEMLVLICAHVLLDLAWMENPEMVLALVVLDLSMEVRVVILV